jgi:hypothetical protein
LSRDISKQTHSYITATVHRYWHSFAVFNHDVMAAIDAIQQSTLGFEFADNLFAVHGMVDLF